MKIQPDAGVMVMESVGVLFWMRRIGVLAALVFQHVSAMSWTIFIVGADRTAASKIYLLFP